VRLRLSWRSTRAEQDRRLPKELISALKSVRIYSMLVPRRYGGVELDAPSAVRAIAALAKLDGSVGWNAMIGHLGSLIPFLVSHHPAGGDRALQGGPGTA
jgi:alkylation response protein AidB-like acyl-CoA dehydrogenase